jgi:hypothetical protein
MLWSVLAYIEAETLRDRLEAKARQQAAVRMHRAGVTIYPTAVRGRRFDPDSIRIRWCDPDTITAEATLTKEE